MFVRLETINDDLFMFEMSKVKYTLMELQLLANRYLAAVNKVETAVEFNSLAALRSGCLDFDDIIKQTTFLRDNLEIIISKARSAKP